MKTTPSLHEINHQALQLLMKEMGPVNTLRFIRQFSTGNGNYTVDRETTYQDATLESLVAEIKANRNQPH